MNAASSYFVAFIESVYNPNAMSFGLIEPRP